MRVATITRIVDGNPRYKVSFTYDEQDRVVTALYQSLKSSNSHAYTNDFTYEEGKATIDVNNTHSHDISRSVVYFYQDRIVASEVFRVQADGVTPDYTDPITYEYAYDGEGQMIQMNRTDYPNSTCQLTWGDGVLQTYTIVGSDYTCAYEFEYSDINNIPSSPFFFELIELGAPEYNLAEPIFYFPHNFGKRPQKLVSKTTVNETTDRKAPNRAAKVYHYTTTYSYNYQLDGMGNITEVVIYRNDKEKERFQMEYEAASGIQETINTHPCPQGIYGLKGIQLSNFAKGLNIIKMSDGQTRKVIK